MAAPAEVTAANLSGKWALNRSLSDSTEPSLSSQGVSWITRKTLSNASVSLTISQYADDTGLHHFDTEQKTLGRSVDLKSILDGKATETDHPLFGKIHTSQKWSSVDSLGEEYLKEGLEKGTTDVVELIIVNDEAGWTSRQVCGVEDVGGERRHTRRSIVVKGDDVVKTRLVYDWQGAN